MVVEEASTPDVAPPVVVPAALDDARRHVRDVATRSGTSFLIGMKSLDRERRDAMFAVYAFCREVDDIADEPGPEPAKRAALTEWRREVDRLYAGRPTRPTTLALQGPVSRFDLPRGEFIALIDGMEMDARAIVGPDPDELALYCRRVAGAVGLLSIRIFGASEPAAPGFALALAEALQLTNILRDLGEDAARGRLYLPSDLLEAHGIGAREPAAVLAHPAAPLVCRDLARRARRRFAEADRLLAACDRRRLRPALLMMGVYDRLLLDLDARGWARPAELYRMSKPRKVWAAFRHGLLRPRPSAPT